MTEDREGQGLQPIGSHLSKIASSLGDSASRPTRSPQASAITGLPALVGVGSSSTGLRHGGTGAVAKLREGADPAATDRVIRASWPQDVERWHASPSVIAASPRLQAQGHRWMTPTPPPASDRIVAVAILECALTPSVAAHLAVEVTRAAALTVPRRESGDDTETWIALMADELAAYPADAVTATLRAWPRQSRWRPTLAEMVPLIDEALHWRRRALSDLRGIRDTADERQAALAHLAAQGGTRSSLRGA